MEHEALLTAGEVWKDTVKVEVINLAMQEDFQKRYLEAMTLDPA